MDSRHAGPRLPLHEEALLLALRDDCGREEPYANLALGVGAAMLAELLLQERFSVETVRKKDFLRLERGTPTGDAVLDEAVSRVAKARRRAQLGRWVYRFAMTKGLMHRVAQNLCDRGILRLEEGRLPWILKRRVYPEVDGRVEEEILGRLFEAVFTETSRIDPRTALLLSISHRTGLLNANFNRTKLEARLERIEQLVQGQVVDKAAMGGAAAAFTVILGGGMSPAWG